MKVCLFLTLLISSNVFAKTQYGVNCKDYHIRIIYDKRPVLTKEILCHVANPGLKIDEFGSPSCVDRKCEILQRKKAQIVIKDYYSNVGSPGFKLCTALGGTPQIFEFTRLKDKWQQIDRCIFNEKDFVEIPMLTREWKDFIVKQ